MNLRRRRELEMAELSRPFYGIPSPGQFEAIERIFGGSASRHFGGTVQSAPSKSTSRRSTNADLQREIDEAMAHSRQLDRKLDEELARDARIRAQLPYRTANLRMVGRVGPENDCAISFKGATEDLVKAKAGGARCVLVEVNSAVGGNLLEAFLVGSALENFKRGGGYVLAHVPAGGRVVSAATVPLLSADFICMDPSARVMVHAPFGGMEDGSALRSPSQATNRLANLYAERTCLGSFDAVHGLLAGCGDTWLSAYDALGYGFADVLCAATRATEIARKLAWSWPCWPTDLHSPRRGALQARAAIHAGGH